MYFRVISEISTSRILKDPDYRKEADYVVMESTYGDRISCRNSVDYVRELADINRNV